MIFVFFFQAEDGIRDRNVTGVQTCALPILPDVTIPMPEDVEAARRSDGEAGIVREAVPAMASAPVVDQVLPAAQMQSTPIAVASVLALAPEPVKPRRPNVGEV